MTSRPARRRANLKTMFGFGNWVRGAAITLLFVAAAHADEPKQKLELRGGDRVEGKILCVGAHWVVVDAAGGPRFIDRSQVIGARESDGSAIDLAARETKETRDVTGLFLDIFNEKVRVNRGEGWFEPTALSSEKGIANALLRTGDELRTGPWGRVKVLLPKGTLLTASRDAVVQFGEGGPSLVRGSARFKDGDVKVAMPEGKVSGQGIDVAFDHTRGRTQLTCYQGTAEVEGDGWKLELFKNHTIDVSNGSGEQSPYVAANASNSFPIDLRIGTKRMQVQPAQTVCLVVIRSSRGPSSPDEREPERERPLPEEPRRPPIDEPRRPPIDEPPPRVETPAESGGGVGRVTRATDAFWHIRSATQQWKITPDKIGSVVLRPGDTVTTEHDVRVSLAFDRPQATIDLNQDTSLVIPPEDGLSQAPFRVKGGQLTARTGSSALTFATPIGDVTIPEGEAIVTAWTNSTQVRTREGRSVLRVGRDLQADAPPGIEVTASTADGRTKLEATGRSGSAPVRIATIVNLQLPVTKALETGRTDDGVVWVTLWNNARLELDGSNEATIEDQDGSLVAVTRGGERRVLEPGMTVRLLRSAEPGPKTAPREQPNERPLVETPESPSTQQPATQPTPKPVKAQSGRETRTLSNGAVLTLVNWGAVNEKPAAGGLVEVDGPGGSALVLAPSARLLLKRGRSGDVTIVTDDHRTITWDQGARTPSFSFRLDQEGKLSLELAEDRALVVDKGASFELELRADGLVHAELVHQTVFVDKGEHLLVDRAGYRSAPSDMAKAAGSK